MLTKILSFIPAFLELMSNLNKDGIEKAKKKRDRYLVRQYKKALKGYWKELKKVHKGDNESLMNAAKELLEEEEFQIHRR